MLLHRANSAKANWAAPRAALGMCTIGPPVTSSPSSVAAAAPPDDRAEPTLPDAAVPA